MDIKEISQLLSELYGLEEVDLKSMEGYDSTNYRVSKGSEKWVLKIYDLADASYVSAQAENEILRKLSHHGSAFPSPIPNDLGQDISIVEKKGKAIRLLTFLEGEFLAEVDHTDKLIKSFGTFLARMDKDLVNFKSPHIESKRTPWDLDNFLDNSILLPFISSPEDRKIVSYFLLQWKTFILERLPPLRESLIHNDANEWNVLTQQGQISGLIDFGDMVYSKLIFELGIAASYLAINKKDPVKTISLLLSSYHNTIPLLPAEVDVLYYLIAGRLCTSVLNSAKNKIKKPESDYITVTEKGAWNLLHKWISINPEKARHEWRKVIGAPIAIKENKSILRRHISIPEVLSLSYKRPIHMTRAAFQYMYDNEGNAILDAYNNIIQVGHCHPDVVEAGQKAMATLNTNTRYLYDALAEYAEHLLGYFPLHLNKVFFVNSGSAAGDLAIRLARTYTQKKQVVVLEHGYHGNTNLGIMISHYKYGHKGGSGKDQAIIQVPMPDVYRGKYQDTDAGLLYAQDVIYQLNQHKIPNLSAFIAEPIIGCGGQIPVAEGYLKLLYPHIRSLGGLCISDEVQTGFGRLGRWFWGFEMHDVVPDMVVLGKPIGNGHPMAALVTTAEIAESFDNGMEFFSSFGGNPVSCEIGNAVLSVIENEKLQHNAKIIGDYIKDQFSRLAVEFPCIGDIRGEGLFLGVDMIKNNSDKIPDGNIARYLINHLRENNILTSLDGPGLNVIKIKPPLCFDRKNADSLISGLKEALYAYFNKSF